MSRSLDSGLSAALSAGAIQPALMALLEFKSGVMGAWSGVGDLVWNSYTFKGVGRFGKISPVQERVTVQADGLSLELLGLPLASLVDAGVSLRSNLVDPVLGTAGLCGAFTDGAGYVIQAVAIGNGPVTLTVPNGATRLQLGTCDGKYADNSGTFSVGVSVNGGTSSSVSVPATAMPWDPVLNAADFPFGENDGTASIVAAAGLRAGDSVVVAWSSGLVSPGGGFPAIYDGNGDPSLPAGAGTYSGGYEPTWYMKSVAPVASALEDVLVGGAAEVYFALLAEGALLGSPYLVWRGIVDQPTVDSSADTFDVTLALESLLTNLGRASMRRYTAADQRLYFPDDIGFNWVETLNDIALRWGS